MKKQGTLHIENGESRLGAELLLREGASDPAGAATSFLLGKGLTDGSQAIITGREVTSNGRTVMYMTDAERLAQVEVAAFAAPKPARKKKKARAEKKQPARKAAPRQRTTGKKTARGTQRAGRRARSKGARRSTR